MSTAVVVEIVLGIVLLALLLGVLSVLRRLQSLRRGGVDVALRPVPASGDLERWRSGIARYRGDQFRWFRISGLRSAPHVVLDRAELEIVDRRPGQPSELHGASSTVLRCRTNAGTWDLAMADDVVTGFSSWLEALPPGRSTGYRQAS